MAHIKIRKAEQVRLKNYVLKEQKTFSECAILLGVNRKTIQRWLQKLQLDIQVKAAQKGPAYEKLYHLYCKEHKNTEEIAAGLGYTTEGILSKMKEIGIGIKQNTGSR